MIHNLSGYLFFALRRPDELRQQLLKSLSHYDVFGTIILANEGINLNLSVSKSDQKMVEDVLFSKLSIPQFELKLSLSDFHPHKRLLVKVKPEIVTMGVQEVSPKDKPAAYIEATELRRWIEENRDFLLLDTRKAFEYEMGSFKNAVNLDGQHFRDFPHEVEAIADKWKERDVVTFCTGGIRCEKGAPLLLSKGFKNVFQLKGGILKYFEECGGEHWEGHCFVFDHRAAVGPDLKPVESLSCQSCARDYNPQKNPKDVDGLSLLCPDCFYEKREHKRLRGQALAMAANPRS